MTRSKEQKTGVDTALRVYMAALVIAIAISLTANNWAAAWGPRLIDFLKWVPAAAPAPSSVLKRQHALAQRRPAYGTIGIAKFSGFPEGRNLFLEEGESGLRYYFRRDYSESRAGAAFFGPMIISGDDIRLSIWAADGSWFSPNVRYTEDVLMSPKDWEAPTYTARFPVVRQDQNEAPVAANREEVVVSLRLARFDPESASGADVTVAGAKPLLFVQDAHGRVERLHFSGRVSLSSGDATDHLVIKPKYENIALLVVGDADLEEVLRCDRSVGGLAIGAYHPDHKHFAAAAPKQDLLLRVAANEKQEELTYDIWAVSSNGDAAKELVLWFLHKSKEDNSRILGSLHGADLPALVAWLNTAYAIEISPEDVDSADSELKTAVRDAVTTRFKEKQRVKSDKSGSN